MHYYKLGNIPDKRHTQFRKPNGSLYHEELFSTVSYTEGDMNFFLVDFLFL